MKRTDNEYWQRLRRDKRLTATGLLAIFAWLVPCVAVNVLMFPGSPSQARGNPIYWLVFAPLAWWATALSGYEPRPVRFLKLALVGALIAAAMVALAATVMAQDATSFWVATAASAVAAAAGWFLYRGSMLEREGPAR